MTRQPSEDPAEDDGFLSDDRPEQMFLSAEVSVPSKQTAGEVAEALEFDQRQPGSNEQSQSKAIDKTPSDEACSDEIASESVSHSLPEPTPLASRRTVDQATRKTPAPNRRLDSHPIHLATSTFLSLLMVLALLLIARLAIPSLVENIRYSWYRGQLRAEYELSGERLKSISLDSLTDVSQLVSRRAGPSVVHINLLRDPDSISEFEALLGDRTHPSLRYEGQGSGFIIDTAGHILTNDHVVRDARAIEVTTSDGRQLLAKVIGTDPLTDLAVIKVEASGLLPANWGNSDDVIVGTPVWAVGSPFGLQQTVTFGIISGKHRVDFRSTTGANEIQGGTPYGDLMQSDVALNKGNSGGPLVNANGQVVGVNAAILGDTFRGVSFSIPSNVAQRVASHLIAEGEVPRGWLGVELADLNPDEKFGDDGTPKVGVRVKRFPTNMVSPAKRAGLKVGDLIVSFEGEEISTTSGLIRRIGESPVGKTITLEVERDLQRFKFEVQLDRRASQL